MNYAEMVKTLAKPGAVILATLTPEDCHNWHMASCLLGEAGEYHEAEGREHRIEELGDLEFYVEGLRQGYGIDHEETTGYVSNENRLPLVVAAAMVFDAMKKQVIYRKELDRVKMLMALNMFEAAMYSERFVLNVSRAEVLDANQKKLLTGKNARYASGQYSDQQAQERADKKESGDA